MINDKLTRYKQKNLTAWVDLSTYCNAGCPQCHRTDTNGLGKVDWLPLVQWSLEEFQKNFTPKDMTLINRFEICGTWGDPFMCKDIYEILKYILENSSSNIQINTNGGMRDDEFWWNVGLLDNRRLQVIFDVDGIDQKMHSHYRRKVDFEKLKSHIQCFTAAGGNALAHIIAFKHNEDFLYKILDMCYNELGITSYVVQPSNRFHKDGKETFIDENGNEFLLEEVKNKNNSLFNPNVAPLRDHSWYNVKGKKHVGRGLWTPKDADVN
jgi:MoaA/NifB/PqqE/SkfB family radical SAM enzyme